MAPLAKSSVQLIGLFVACMIGFPVVNWCDYSSVALLFAMSGYLQRQMPDSPAAREFFVATMILHFLIESNLFKFHLPAELCMVVVLGGASYLLYRFSLRSIAGDRVPAGIRRALLWASRNTLPIYALHVIILMVLERYWFPERFAHFRRF
jgi:hypothetical protein